MRGEMPHHHTLLMPSGSSLHQKKREQQKKSLKHNFQVKRCEQGSAFGRSWGENVNIIKKVYEILKELVF